MKYGQVAGIEKPISRLVQGMVQVPRGSDAQDAAGLALLDAALAAGITTFDTAQVYGKDAFLGRWIASRGVREQVAIIAKGAHHNEVRKRVTPFDIASDLHDTLAHMKTPYIDIFVLHRDDPEYPVEPIVDALNAHIREGKIRAFGASNWSTTRLQAANDYAAASGQAPFALSSPQFSLADQKVEPWPGCISITGASREAERRWYAEHHVPVFAWSSMAGGFLSGRFVPGNELTFTDYFDQVAVQCYASPDNYERVNRAREIAERHGLTMPQIALAYVFNYPLDIYALVGSATPEEVAANVVALNTGLTAQEMAYLDLHTDTPD